MNRRHFLFTGTAALTAAALASCGKKENLPTLRLYTWADYIDPELVEAFEKEAKCKLVIDTFDSNEAMYAKLTAGATGYDLLTPSSYMAKSLAREKWIIPLDHSKIPNLKHVDPAYLARAIDPQMTHTVPYMMACTCLGWLGSKIPNAESSYALLDRPELKGRITLLDDMREVLGAALLSLGYSLNAKSADELAQARDIVRRWKANIAKFDNEQYKSGLASGEFHLVQGYAGDLLQVAEENPDIQVSIPKEGSAFSCDDLCISKDSKNVDLAYQFIDFITKPENAAQNMLAISNRAPNVDAYPLLPEEFRANDAIFPDDDVFAKCQPIDDLGDALALWSKTWDEVKAS
ncbi:MAG: spermidine/putrescine ABC transporter substrate-binding protein [Luteolibacter sp.]